MLHTKLRGNRSTGSGEDFEELLPHMSVEAILVTQLSFPLPIEAPHKIGLGLAKRIQRTV